MNDRDRLVVRSITEVAAEVDAAPARRFLFRPVWSQDAYGVLAAKDKAGKTWMLLDAAVSAASGTAWLEAFPCDAPGAVLMFLGEGGPSKAVRRLRAICESRDVRLESLPIRVCFRVPHLTQKEQIDQVYQEVAASHPCLIVLDPLYLSARGAKSSDLIDMGAALESIQHAAASAGAALLVAHHWNKTGQGGGRDRMSGAGPAAWGRVLVSISVEQQRREPDGASVATLLMGFVGDEIAETDVRVRRRVWADDPNDLDSALHYTVETVDADVPTGPTGLPPAARRVLGALKAGADMTVADVGDAVARDGFPLQKRTIQDALKRLREAGLAEPAGAEDGVAMTWNAVEAERAG